MAQSNENTAISFTLGDRDRIMRTEQTLISFQKNTNERFESLRNELNAKFENIDVKFEGINDKFEGINDKFEGINDKFEGINDKFESQQKQLDNMYVLLFFILGSIMSLIGFVIYDRRTAIKPVTHKQETMEKILVDYSRKHSDLAEILKKAGIF
jgi:chaperonin cofactor prefoldin